MRRVVKVPQMFTLFDTHGFPMADFILQCERSSTPEVELRPDWLDFLRESRVAGWNWPQVDKACREACQDTGGDWDEVLREAWTEAAVLVVSDSAMDANAEAVLSALLVKCGSRK